MSASAPYGAPLGVVPPCGLVVHSNHAPPPQHRLARGPLGVRWQCVELARRDWVLRHRCLLGDVRRAADLLRRAPVLALDPDVGPVVVRRWRNGRSPLASLVPGALLVWRARGRFANTGHVAVVVGRPRPGRVAVAEQNVNNTPWPPGRPWSRLPPGPGGGGSPPAPDLLRVRMDPRGRARVSGGPWGWLTPRGTPPAPPRSPCTPGGACAHAGPPPRS